MEQPKVSWRACRLVLNKDSGRVRWCFGEEKRWKAKTKLLALVPVILLTAVAVCAIFAHVSSSQTDAQTANENFDKELMENEDREALHDFRTAFLTSSVPFQTTSSNRPRKHKREISAIPFERGRDDEYDFNTWDSMVHEESIENVRAIQAKIMIKYMNTKVNPCDDFYNYACGNWDKYNPIPPDRVGFDTFEQLRERLDLVLRSLLEDDAELVAQSDCLILPEFTTKASTNELTVDIVIKNNDTNCLKYKRLDAATKAKFFFKSCMDTRRLEMKSAKPLLDLLMKLGGWPVLDPNWDATKFDFVGLLGTLRLYNNDILISEWIGPDIKNSEEHVVQIDQTTLGLPSREYFLDPSYRKYLEAYRNYIVTICELLGAPTLKAKDDVNDIITFETKLAYILTNPNVRRNVTDMYSRTTIGELQHLFPQFDWQRYVSIILERPVNTNLPIVVFCTPYLTKLFELLARTPERTVANYIIWRFVRHRANNLDKRFDDARQSFYHVILGRKEMPPKWKTCVSQVNSNLGMALGNLFVNKYFDETSKNDTLIMTIDLQRAFKDILEDAEWLDSDTKGVAKKKIEAMRLRIGYPDFILDTETLTEKLHDVIIHPHYYFENILSILLHVTRKEQAKIGMGVNKDHWHTAPAIVNAYYSRNKNQIMFPAGILQPPFYHRHFPKALNYGGIGVVIGHEITHGFDDKGRLFDQEGNLHKWWHDSSVKKFHEGTQCLIEQYNNFIIPEINEQVDGTITQGENIADNGGVKQSFRAYQQWLKKNPNADELLPGLNLTSEQLFFLNFAQVWCGSILPDAAKNKAKTAVHAPGRFRVIGTLTNSQYFSDTFKCPLGSPMNPKKKCGIW